MIECLVRYQILFKYFCQQSKGFWSKNPKMEVEEIVIHCLILAVVLVNSVLLFQVWKYLNSKPPGMQTILHELAKDGILLIEAQLIINWITWVKVVPQVNYYVAMIAVKTALFVGISFLLWSIELTYQYGYLFGNEKRPKMAKIFHFYVINSKIGKPVWVYLILYVN